MCRTPLAIGERRRREDKAIAESGRRGEPRPAVGLADGLGGFAPVLQANRHACRRHQLRQRAQPEHDPAARTRSERSRSARGRIWAHRARRGHQEVGGSDVAASSTRGAAARHGARGRVRRRPARRWRPPSSHTKVRRRASTCSSDSASRRTRCAPASDAFGIRTVPRRIPIHRPRPRRCDGPRRG